MSRQTERSANYQALLFSIFLLFSALCAGDSARVAPDTAPVKHGAIAGGAGLDKWPTLDSIQEDTGGEEERKEQELPPGFVVTSLSTSGQTEDPSDAIATPVSRSLVSSQVSSPSAPPRSPTARSTMSVGSTPREYEDQYTNDRQHVWRNRERKTSESAQTQQDILIALLQKKVYKESYFATLPGFYDTGNKRHSSTLIRQKYSEALTDLITHRYRLYGINRALVARLEVAVLIEILMLSNFVAKHSIMANFFIGMILHYRRGSVLEVRDRYEESSPVFKALSYMLKKEANAYFHHARNGLESIFAYPVNRRQLPPNCRFEEMLAYASFLMFRYGNADKTPNKQDLDDASFLLGAIKVLFTHIPTPGAEELEKKRMFNAIKEGQRTLQIVLHKLIEDLPKERCCVIM